MFIENLIVIISVFSTLDSALSQSLAGSTAGTGNGTTLLSYVSGGQIWTSRGEWYNIVAWAARTSNCANNATSVTCMACSQELPISAIKNGVAPIAVANQLWFTPERSATCCPGIGTQPYVSSVSNPLNYGAIVQYDAMKQLPYFTAMIIEWLDRNFTDEYALSYPTQQTAGVESFGTWPIQYEGVPCPVGNTFLEYQFLNTAEPFPVVTAANQTAWLQSGSSDGLPTGVGNTLCNNQPNEPCGAQGSTAQNPFSFIKFQVTNQRIPIASVELQLPDGEWVTLDRSGDGYWEPAGSLSSSLDASKPVNVQIACSDGSPAKLESGLVPAQMLCKYQDPLCMRYTGTIQC